MSASKPRSSPLGRIPLPRPLGTLKFLAAWLVPWRPAIRVTPAGSGLAFYVHHRDTIGRHIAKYGTHEPLLTLWLADVLDAVHRGVVIDVGANIGWHTLHAARHRNVEAVVAFEPDPFNAWLLGRSLAANGIDNVIVDGRALAAAPAIARLYRYKSSNFGRHSLAADYGFGWVAVPASDLDGALASLNLATRPISLIKIDVEGYEPAVIAGAAQALKRTDVVVLEYSPALSAAGGLSTDDMLAYLSAFTPFVLHPAGGTVRIDIEELRAADGVIDVIFMRSDRLPALAPSMGERDRGALTLAAIMEQNKRVKTPLRGPTSP